MKAFVDRDACIGCGLCESICPDVFAMDDEAKAAVVVPVIPSKDEKCSEEARDACPVTAITIE